MPRQTLLLADDNEDFRLAMVRELESHFRVIPCCTGLEALTLARRLRPEIFVLDVMLAELDGISLLEQLAQEGITPMVLVATGAPREYVEYVAQRLDIGYVMVKPCPPDKVLIRVLDLQQCLKSPLSREERILRELLQNLQFQCHHHGYQCLLAAILLCQINPHQSITKELYPAAAKKCGSTGPAEHCIRSAIERAWKQRDPACWEPLFPRYVKRPSNGAFIHTLAQELDRKLASDR